MRIKNHRVFQITLGVIICLLLSSFAPDKDYNTVLNGLSKKSANNTNQEFNFTWILQNSSINPINPPPLNGHTMDYDSKADKIILFGGFNGSFDSNETWSFDYDTNTWTNMNPPVAPTGRRLHSMTYNAQSDKFVLFGGYNEIENLNDTWTYSYTENNWTKLFPDTQPDARRGQRMSYDVEKSLIVMQGGINDNSDKNYAETWLFNLENKTWIKGSNGPIAYDHGIVYNSNSKAHLMFINGETWQYTVNNDTWKQLTTNNNPPITLLHFSFSFNSNSNMLIIFGGDADGIYGTDNTWFIIAQITLGLN